MSRFCTAAISALAIGLGPIVAAPAFGQEADAPSLSTEAPTYWSFLTADRILRVLVQGGIVQARNFARVSYDDISYTLLSNELILTGLSVREYEDVEFPQIAGCDVSVDRIAIGLAPIDIVDSARLTFTVTGATAGRGCFDPETAAVLTPLGLTEARIDRAVIYADYDYPTGAASLSGEAVSADLVEFAFNAELDYVGFDMNRRFDPVPMIYVSSADLTATDRGLWERVSTILPPEVIAPDSVEALLRSELPREFGGDFRELSAAQTGFIDALATTAGAFVAEPGTVSIDFNPGRPVLLGDYLDDTPDAIFGALSVQNALPERPGFVRLSRADIDAARDLEPEGNRVVLLETGRALIEGRGAPRNVTAGLEVLQPLLDDGDPLAQLLALNALEESAPAEAYSIALSLGASGETAAAAALDRLQGVLPLEDVIAAQGGIDAGALSADDRTAMRSLALSALSGIGAERNYAQAYAAALLALAAGDPGARTVLNDIDARSRLSSPADQAVWSEVIANATEAANDVWYQ